MFKKLYFLTLSIVLLTSCNKSDDISSDNDVKDFVWKAMNSWYNWQSNVADLSDSKDNSNSAYNSFLSSYTNAEELFDDLLYQPGVVDRFSWFIEDYDVQQQAFQGISTSFGINQGFVRVTGTDYVVMYIKHIIDNSPADLAGFKRGDIINGFNGTIMTTSNFQSALNPYRNDETVEFNFVESDGTTPLKDVTITKGTTSSNPVYFSKTFDDINGKKVGYLVYNSFASSFNDELNATFGDFATNNINELVLDFRLNGGGSLESCAYLASMIYGEGNEDDAFAKLIFNSKKTEFNNSYFFEDTMSIYNTSNTEIGTEVINRITGLSRVYVLTSPSTASASEMIINGLKPYLEVIVVGETTFGKNVGSLTLYDSPRTEYTDEALADSSHSYAIQPIIFQIFNDDNESDFIHGFEPNILVEEWNYWDTILPFGDENEVVLKAALDDIRGFSAKQTAPVQSSEKIDIDLSTNKFEKEMYITPNFFNKN